MNRFLPMALARLSYEERGTAGRSPVVNAHAAPQVLNLS